MRTTFLLFCMVISLSILLTGCFRDLRIEGNGDPVSEYRLLTNFDKVYSSGSFIVNITPGDKYQVMVKAESNLLPYISTEVSRGNLDIDVKGIHSLDPSIPIEIDIVTPSLSAIEQSGSGEINAGSFEAVYFEIVESGSGKVRSSVDCGSIGVTVSGSGLVVLDGEGSQADFTISGSGEISADNFMITDCKAVVSGSGKMYVNIARSLNANISGSGFIYYLGNPQLSVTVSGSGKVIKSH
jgi:hypothetical protein